MHKPPFTLRQRQVRLRLLLLEWQISQNKSAQLQQGKMHILKQPAAPKTVASLLSIWKNVGDPILDMRSDYTIPVYYHSKIFDVIIDWDYWRNKDRMFPEDALIWFTDGSRANSGTESGIFGLRPNRSFSFPLGKFATVFKNQSICHSTICM